MTTTPTLWKGAFTVNDGITAGGQSSPVTIGLAGGGFVTIWVDDTNNVDNNPGLDIVAQRFDAQGIAVGVAFQVNQSFSLDGENDPAIAALPDGGFVIAYEDTGSGTGGDSSIRFERYDASGAHVFSGTIVSGTIGGITHANPSISVLPNGDFVVSYQEVNAGDTDVNAKVVNGVTNVAGPTLAAGQNSADVDANADTVILSNGNILTVYEETDAGVVGIEAKIITTAGAQVDVVQVVAAGTDAHAAALTGGGFVTVWRDPANAGDIRADIRSNTGAMVTANFLVTGGGGVNSQNEPEVIGLKDGSFFVVWDDDTAGLLRGQRFSATGTIIGTSVLVANGAAATAPELALTDDGRILVTFNNALGEVSQLILDPRDNVITGDSTSETITSRINGATVDGGFGNDTLLGQAANDMLIGGSGSDVLKGGDGDDLLLGGLAKDTVDGGAGRDTIRILEGEFGDDIIGGTGADTLDLALVTSRGASVDLTGIWTFTPGFGGSYTINTVENVTGTALADTITGSLDANILLGENGDDTLSGGGGNDTLDGEAGNDVLIGGAGGDFLNGGSGSSDTVSYAGSPTGVTVNLATNAVSGGHAAGDTIIAFENVTGSASNDFLTGGVGFNTLSGGAGNDTLDGQSGNNRLEGGTGIDTLIGGDGNDTFALLPQAVNRDVIMGFETVDSLEVSAAVFGGGLVAGALNAAQFVSNATGLAGDADDRFIYNFVTGDLFFDINGNAGGGSRLIANLAGAPALNAGDFIVG